MKNEKAFPGKEWIDSDDPYLINPIRHTGMDLRDYFAAKAMQKMVKRPFDLRDAEIIAEVSYDMADEMMKARLKCEN